MASSNSQSDSIYPTTDYGIAGIIKICDIKNEYEARFNFDRLIKFLYVDNSFEMGDTFQHNIDSSFSLMRSLNPTNNEEKVAVAMVVLCRMFGMDKLFSRDSNDQKTAFKLLKVSNRFLQHINNNHSATKTSTSFTTLGLVT